MRFLLASTLLSSSALAAPVFTGQADLDFAIPGTMSYPDPAGIDVGVPLSFPTGTVSGWDIDTVELHYDRATDTLAVGFNTYGIAGDADGDGNPGAPSSLLADIGGFDPADLGPLESVAISIDIDEDGVFDVIAGVPALGDVSVFGTYTFTGSPFAPGFAFGVPLPGYTGFLFASPSAAAPDVEMTIDAFSLIPPSSGVDLAGTFQFSVFAGSFSDAGVGEDFYPGAGQTDIGEIPMCGDGSLQEGEACDDGNLQSGDGCDTTCQVESAEPFGCTYTIGWYKTHNPLAKQSHMRVSWPLPHDAQLCGRTWLGWLNTQPRGDKWIILAHQWIGAMNNAADASSTPDVDAALARGAEILQDCRVTSGEAAEAVGLSGLLDGYNNGLVGPGHCD